MLGVGPFRVNQLAPDGELSLRQYAIFAQANRVLFDELTTEVNGKGEPGRINNYVERSLDHFESVARMYEVAFQPVDLLYQLVGNFILRCYSTECIARLYDVGFAVR